MQLWNLAAVHRRRFPGHDQPQARGGATRASATSPIELFALSGPSPRHVDLVATHGFVARHERQSIADRLRDQHPVERVPVQER
jgi:hypothetical protein